ncbi:hypothetical protein [Flavisphingomonas formosensis]|uniref:hypothetical protein n=1 Tax=Flavisphingomonas formosensis TaxID=861534 RepID=UPI0012F84BD0|nr:hypothetical protein [Sphingomonas formosensis]
MGWPIPDLVDLVPEPRPHERALGAHLVSVLLQMALAIAISAAAAGVMLISLPLQAMVVSEWGLTPSGTLLLFAPVFLLATTAAAPAVERLSVAGLRALFLIYALLVGLALGTILIV